MDGNIKIPVKGQMNPQKTNTQLPSWFLKEIVDFMGDKQLYIK